MERKFELEALQKENNANRIHELGKLQKEQSRQGKELISLEQKLGDKIQGKAQAIHKYKKIYIILVHLTLIVKLCRRA